MPLVPCLAIIEFPITISLDQQPSDAEWIDIHTRLAQHVNYYSSQNNDKNYFACAFVFQLQSGYRIPIFVTPYHLLGIKNIKIIIFESGSFKGSLLAIGRMQVAFYLALQADPCPENAAVNLFISSYMATMNRFSEQAMDLVNILRWNDSEMNAISFLQDSTVIDRIIENVECALPGQKQESQKQNTSQIVSVEFHGCTTRDMCPFCFAHMNMAQWLANQSSKESFLGLLIAKLRQKGLTENAVPPVTTFISSLRVININLNFIPLKFPSSSSSIGSSESFKAGTSYKYPQYTPSSSTSPSSSMSSSSSSSSSSSIGSSESFEPGTSYKYPKYTPSSSKRPSAVRPLPSSVSGSLLFKWQPSTK